MLLTPGLAFILGVTFVITIQMVYKDLIMADKRFKKSK